jgi:hypothetical protein
MAGRDGRADGRSRVLNRLQSDVHDSARKEHGTVKPQVKTPARGSRLPAEVSAAWWSPRSSKPV